MALLQDLTVPAVSAVSGSLSAPFLSGWQSYRCLAHTAAACHLSVLVDHRMRQTMVPAASCSTVGVVNVRLVTATQTG